MDTLLQTLFEISVSVGALILMLAALGPVLDRRYAAKWRYWVWLLLAVRLLLPIKLTMPLLLPVAPVQLPAPQRIVYEMAPPAEESAENAVQPPTFVLPEQQAQNAQTQASEEEATLPGPQQQNRTLTLADLLLGGWMLGAAGLISTQLLCYAVQKRRILRRAVSAPELWPIAQREAELLGLRRTVPVWYAPMVSGPVLIGLVRPRILLPKHSYSARELSMILRHELIHQRRHDVAYKLLLMVICCLHWANPAVWLMASLARTDIERACDEEVVRGQTADYRADYGTSILNLLRRGAGQGLLCSTSFSAGKRSMAKRITGIFDTRKKRKGAAALTMLLVLSLAASSFVACTEGAGASSVPSDAPEQAEPLDNALVPAQAMTLIENVENYSLGSEFNGEPPEECRLLRAFFFTALPTEASRTAYEESEMEGFYSIPFSEAEKIYSFLTGNPAEANVDTTDCFFEDFKVTIELRPIELALLEITELGEGETSYRFARSYEGKPLRPVTYTLRETVATDVPEPLREQYSEGEPLYQLVSVVNEPVETLNPAVKTVEIGTVEEFLAFVEDYNENGWGYEGNTYQLTGDLDLAGVAFQPIGQNIPILWGDPRDVSNEGFNSIFDGNGHTIRNMTITDETTDLLNNRGLFCIIGKNGVVKNLNIGNAKVEGAAPPDGGSRSTGILAGICHGKLENCSVQGEVKGTLNVGGLCGDLMGGAYESDTNPQNKDAVAINCNVIADVAGTSGVGGFACNVVHAQITDCTVNGTITVVKDKEGFEARVVGGFAGFINVSELRSASTSVAITQETTADLVGAFVGDGLDWNVTPSSFLDCHYDPAKSGDLPPIAEVNGQTATGQEEGIDITPIKGDLPALNKTLAESKEQIGKQQGGSSSIDPASLAAFNEAKKQAEEALK